MLQQSILVTKLLLQGQHMQQTIIYLLSRGKWFLYYSLLWILGFPHSLMVKNPPANARDVGLLPGPGRPLGEGNGNPLQCSCLGHLTDRDLALLG